MKIELTEDEIKLTKACVADSIKKLSKISKKWNTGVLGPNPYNKAIERCYEILGKLQNIEKGKQHV